MTGYNHYPSCGCGWCVYSDRPHFRIEQFKAQFAERDAKTLLARHSVTSLASCYVNPNAQCPVCAAPVFFYANRFGSRVYFDDLGPPWPKHPCTDDPRYRPSDLAQPAPFLRRPKGVVVELVGAARIIGKRPERSLWKLMEVITVEAGEGTKTLKLRSIQSDDEERTISVIGPDCSIASGDFVHLGAAEIAFFDIKLFAPQVAPIQPRVVRSNGDDLARARSLVATWQATGVSNPEQIAERLNHARVRTPSGEPWRAVGVQRLLLGYEVRGAKLETDSRKHATNSRKRAKRKTKKLLKHLATEAHRQ
ncbi:MAG: hypothetical protein ABR878_09135 [Roseiarcus sp.]